MCAARKDLTGMQFGEWTVIKYDKDRKWECSEFGCVKVKKCYII